MASIDYVAYNIKALSHKRLKPLMYNILFHTLINLIIVPSKNSIKRTESLAIKSHYEPFSDVMNFEMDHNFFMGQ